MCIRDRGKEASASRVQLTILVDKYFLDWRENIPIQIRLKLRSTYFRCNALFWLAYLNVYVSCDWLQKFPMIPPKPKCEYIVKQRRMISWVNVSHHILSQSEIKESLILNICSLTVSRAQRLLHVFLWSTFIWDQRPTSIRFALHQSLGLASAL